MPEEGLQAGPVKLELPAMYDKLGKTRESKKELLVVESGVEEQIEVERIENPTDSVVQYSIRRIKSELMLCMPDGDSCYLDPVFAAMDSAQMRHVRVLHYGDSQIEGDRISATIREYLQEKFGGAGVGMLSFYQPLGRLTVYQNTSQELAYRRGYGPSSWRGDHRRYGPMYQVCLVDDSVSTLVQPIHRDKYPHCGSFTKVAFCGKRVPGSEKGQIRIQLGNEDGTIDLTPDSLGYRSVRLSKSYTKLKVEVEGAWELYSLQLDDTLGVSLDNIPMRSNDGTTFSGIDEATIRPFLRHENIRLVLLQFGTNAVPWLTDSTRISNWGRMLGRQIDWLHRQCPKARFVLVGPPDMSTMVKGEMHTYPLLTAVVEEMRRTAITHRTAFWSIYDAMGGEDSMQAWVEAQPALAGKDYVHFTELGAERMAQLFNEVLEYYYQNYQLRKYLHERIESYTDTVDVAD